MTTKGMTLDELAAAHGLTRSTAVNWSYQAELKPVGRRTTDVNREAFLYDPAAFAAVAAANTPPAGWPTLQDAALSAGLSRQWMYKLWAEGRVKGVKVNGRVYLDPAAVKHRFGTPASRGDHKRLHPRSGPRRPPDAEGDPDDEKTFHGDAMPSTHRRTVIPFGPSGLKLYQSDLDFLARVRERFPRGDGRDGR